MKLIKSKNADKKLQKVPFVHDRRFYLVAVFCLIAIFQSGLRDINNLPDNNDTPIFDDKYHLLLNTPWKSVLSDFAFVSSEYSGRDSGYEVFVKLTQLFVQDFTFFMFLTAIIFIVPFGMIIYKYAKSYEGTILSFLIYFSIFTNIVNGFMRQAIALGITLFAIRFILSRDWKKYYALMFIALSIHSSAIAAFPFYFLPKICSSKKWFTLAFIASPILVSFQRVLFMYLLSGGVYDNYVEKEAVNPINYLLLLVSICLLAFFYYEELKKTDDYEILISSVIGTLLLMPVVFLGNIMLRISYYYVMVLIPLLAVIFDLKSFKNVRTFLYAFAIIFFLYMTLRK